MTGAGCPILAASLAMRQDTEAGSIRNRREERERNRIRSMPDSLRKGFGIFLFSIGVSSPAKKGRRAPEPLPKTDFHK